MNFKNFNDARLDTLQAVVVESSKRNTLPVRESTSKVEKKGSIIYADDTDSIMYSDGFSWIPISAVGGVTQVNTGVGLEGGPITSTGTISLEDTTVVPGDYTNSNISVDQKGRIISISNGNISGNFICTTNNSGLVSIGTLLTNIPFNTSEFNSGGFVPVFGSIEVQESGVFEIEYWVAMQGLTPAVAAPSYYKTTILVNDTPLNKFTLVFPANSSDFVYMSTKGVHALHAGDRIKLAAKIDSGEARLAFPPTPTDDEGVEGAGSRARLIIRKLFST